jgi:UDP-glucose 4-epimerase
MSIVWITGAKGFIGRHLSQYLANNANLVLGIGHGAWPSELAIQNGISYWINGEIEDSNLWQLLEHSGKPDTIFHLAGGSSVGFSLQSPKEDFYRTVASTATLLDWIRIFTPKTKLVVISSAAVYGNTAIQPITEIGRYTPYSPYGFHKRTLELLCESYTQNFDLLISIVRLFSIYGPGLYKQLIWDLCCRLSHAPVQLEMQGTGKELRDWLYITDAVKILATVCQHQTQPFAIINGGTGFGTSVRDVVSRVCQAWHLSPQIHFSGKNRLGDPQQLVADITELQKLGVEIEYTLDLGVAAYVDWFKSQM